MSKPPALVSAPPVEVNASLARAYLLMERFKCRHLPVCANDKIVGIVSRREIEALIAMYVSTGSLPAQSQARVGDHMQSPVRSVDVGCQFSDVIRLMLDERIEAVVVKDGDATIGFISRDDLLELLADVGAKSKSTVVSELLKLSLAH